MAEEEKGPMSIEALRAKKAAGSSSGSENAKKSGSSQKVASARSSSENLKAREVGIEQRTEKVRQLREKQADERKKRNDERRAAFEERKKQRELEERAKWEAMKEQVLKQGSAPPKMGTGRKLPSIPAERPRTAGQARPSSIPKLSRPTSAVVAPTKNTSPGGSSGELSPTSTPSNVRLSLGGSKSASASNLSTAPQRRGSSGSVGTRPQSASKRQSISGNKPAANQLSTGKSLSKAQSTSAIHTIGSSRKGSMSGLHKVGHSSAKKAESKPKAGMMDEAAAKQALAERRRKAREEAERLAMLDKQRQEEERLKKEEEERIRAEEEAKEEARMRELAELLQQQEEERLKQAMAEKAKHDEEEAERAAVEAKQKEEERLAREEEERKAREEAERKAAEEEERRKQEEIERQERRRRVEQIMSRTRQTANTPVSDDPKPVVQVPPNNSQESINLDTGDTKRKVNEILQKVKGLSGSQTNLTQAGCTEETSSLSTGLNVSDASKPNEEEQMTSATADGTSELNTSEPTLCKSPEENSEHRNLHESEIGISGAFNGGCIDAVNHNDDKSHVNGSADVLSNGNSLVENVDFSGNVQCNPPDQLTAGVSDTREQNNAEASTLENAPSMKNTPKESDRSVGMDNHAGIVVTGDVVDGEVSVENMGPELLVQTEDDERSLWKKAEQTMKARETQVIEALENSGIVAEGDDDAESEETYLWKVVERKIEIAEVV